jgi:hypothetical protein
MVDVFAGILCDNDSGEDEEKLKKPLEHEDVSAAVDGMVAPE